MAPFLPGLVGVTISFISTMFVFRCQYRAGNLTIRLTLCVIAATLFGANYRMYAEEPPPHKVTSDIASSRLSVKARQEQAHFYLKNALSKIATITNPKQRDNAYSYAVTLLTKLGDIPESQNATSKIEEVGKRESCLSLLVEAQAKANDFSNARRTAEAMIPGVWKLMAFRHIAEAYVRKRDLPSALRIVDEMGLKENAGKIGRVTVLSGIATEQEQTGDLSAALSTIENAHDDSLMSDALAYVAAAQARGGDIPAALHTIERISVSFWAAHALGSIAAGQVRTGDLAGAEHTAKAMVGLSEHGIVLCRIAEARAQTGDVPGALQLAECIVNELWRADAMSRIATAQAEAGDMSEAQETVGHIKNPEVEYMAIGNVAAVELLRGNSVEVDKLLSSLPTSYQRAEAEVRLAFKLLEDPNNPVDW